MQSSIAFVLDGRVTHIDFHATSPYTPTTTVLNYLRSLPTHKGVKEGCAEGDCGACTVVLGEVSPGQRIRYTAVDSCLVFLPMLHGKQLVTVENLRSPDGELHPVQQSMVEKHASQCGFCTPGIAMSMFSLYKNHDRPGRAQVDEALTGNLCRCTGYKPIVEAAMHACVREGRDHFMNDEDRVAEFLAAISSDSLVIQCNGQTYFQPGTLEEALALVEAHPHACVVSGGTDVALRVTKKHEFLQTVIDLSAVPELKMVGDDRTTVTIGAGVVLSDVEKLVAGAFPALVGTFSVFGSQQIRNLATLGGNLGTASPISDTLSALLPYNASVVLQSVKAKREVSLDDYLVGYRKTLRLPDELIIAVRIPKPLDGAHVRWYKISKRRDLDISTASAGFRLETDAANRIHAVKLVYGGMAEMVKRAKGTEGFLVGKEWSRETVEGAMPLIDRDFQPISDARGSAEFRRVVARNLLMKFWCDTQAKPAM